MSMRHLLARHAGKFTPGNPRARMKALEVENGLRERVRYTERTFLVKLLYRRVGPHWTRPDGSLMPERLFGIKLSSLKLTVRDLYFIKSLCEAQEHQGIAFHVTFWASIKARA